MLAVEMLWWSLCLASVVNSKAVNLRAGGGIATKMHTDKLFALPTPPPPLYPREEMANLVSRASSFRQAQRMTWEEAFLSAIEEGETAGSESFVHAAERGEKYLQSATADVAVARAGPSDLAPLRRARGRNGSGEPRGWVLIFGWFAANASELEHLRECYESRGYGTAVCDMATNALTSLTFDGWNWQRWAFRHDQGLSFIRSNEWDIVHVLSGGIFPFANAVAALNPGDFRFRGLLLDSAMYVDAAFMRCYWSEICSRPGTRAERLGKRMQFWLLVALALSRGYWWTACRKAFDEAVFLNGLQAEKLVILANPSDPLVPFDGLATRLCQAAAEGRAACTLVASPFGHVQHHRRDEKGFFDIVRSEFCESSRPPGSLHTITVHPASLQDQGTGG